MRTFLITAMLAVAVLCCSTNTADASFRMRIEDMSTGTSVGVVLTDNSPGDIASATGAIVYSGAIGNFTISVTTALSKPLTTGIAQMDLNNVSITYSGSGGKLRITTYDDGFTGGGDGGLIISSGIGGTLSGPAGSSISANSWVNPNDLTPNLGGDTGAIPTNLGAITGLPPSGSVAAWGGAGYVAMAAGSPAFSSNSSSGFVKNGPYSIMSQATVNFTGAGNVSFDLNTQVLPAPAGLVIALTGLPILGLGVWLRRRGTQLAV